MIDDQKVTDPFFKIGDYVRVQNKQRKKRFSPKLQNKSNGPYKIIRKQSLVIFSLNGLNKKKSDVILNQEEEKDVHEQLERGDRKENNKT